MTKVSLAELDMMKLPDKVPSMRVMEKLVLPAGQNVYTSLDIDMTPYLKLPIECIGDTRFFVLGLIGPTQGGKSTYLQVAVADTIDQNPGTCLYVLPDMKQGAKQLKEKVIDPIKRTPELQKHIVQPESKTLTKEIITLDHMSIYLGWSNSASSLSSTPCIRAFFDEVRLFRKNLGQESNALMLGLDRLTVAREAGLAQAYMVSTPSDEGDLLYQQLQIPDTTVLYWYWRCQSCGKYMIPDFFTMIKKPVEGKKVTCNCKFCNSQFDGRKQKREINKHGRYAPAGQDGTTDLKLGRLTERVFFRFCSLSSPFRPFQLIWDEFVRTKKHVSDYRNFHQAWLAKFWKLTVSTLTSADLAQRKGDYLKGVVPEGTKVITAGVDTQDDGFFIVVRAWGADRQTWIIDEFEIVAKMGELKPVDLAALFKEQVEDRIYKTEDGTPWQIVHYAIDSAGHRTKEVYDIAEHLRNMILIKGRDNQTETIVYSRAVFGLYTVRTGDYLEETEKAVGKAFWHLPKDVSQDFLEQWVSAKKTYVQSKQTGSSKVVWFKEKQNDFRYADVHSYIAVDIPWSGSTLRRKLSVEDWSYNPMEARIKAEALQTNEVMDNFNPDDDIPFSPQTGDGFSFSFGEY